MDLIYVSCCLKKTTKSTGSLATQLVVLGVTSVLIELAALTLYATLCARAGHYAGNRLRGPLERIGGAFLIAAGAKLAAAREA